MEEHNEKNAVLEENKLSDEHLEQTSGGDANIYNVCKACDTVWRVNDNARTKTA